MSDLEPITRAENFWVNEGDLEPITRKEQYIKHLYDETQVVPEYPKTREEYFINKAGEELHDVTIEQLTATENRTYSEEGVAYSPVIVNVPQTTLTTLDVTENGTYTAPSGTAYNEVDVDVPLPENAYLLKDIPNTPSPIATFTDGSPLPMPKLEVAVEPQQDLHGYDSPWVGGAGKNKLFINSLSISGGGITATIDRDGNNNVVSITVNGTASGVVYVILSTFTLPSGTYTMSGCPSNGGTDSYRLYDDKHTSWADNGSGASFTLSEASQVAPTIRIANGYTVNNLKFYPMIESGSQKTAFAPYSNICPISGWDEVNVTVADDVDNPTTTKTITIQLGDTYYGGKLDVVNGVLTVERVMFALNGSENWATDIVGDNKRRFTCTSLIDLGVTTTTTFDAISNIYVNTKSASYTDLSEVFILRYLSQYNKNRIDIMTEAYQDVESFKAFLNSTNMQIVYELATPTTIQLTPTAVKSLLGSNNLWADTGDVVDGQYFSKEV